MPTDNTTTETAPAAVPPPTTGPTVAPTTTRTYKTSEHMDASGRFEPTPGSLERLQRLAGVKPTETPAAPAAAPAPATAAAPPPKPAPFVPADELPEVPIVKVPATETKPATATEAPDKPQQTSDVITPELARAANAQLREAYEKLKKDFAERASDGDLTKKQLADFQRKSKEFEDQIKALKPLEEKTKVLEKQLLDADERLRVTDYLRHPEFHNKFVKPVADAMEEAKALVSELIADPEGSPRAASMDDFNAVLGAPSLTAAISTAKQLFGADVYNSVVALRNKVLSAQRAHSAAVKDAAAKSAEWQQREQERAAQTVVAVKERFQHHVQTLVERFPQLYSAPKDDAEAAAALTRGAELARIIVDGKPADMDQESFLGNMAKVYQRAASSPMKELTIQRLQSENAELKAKLAAYDKSIPSVDGRLLSDGSSAIAGQATDGNVEAFRQRERAKLSQMANRHR